VETEDVAALESILAGTVDSPQLFDRREPWRSCVMHRRRSRDWRGGYIGCSSHAIFLRADIRSSPPMRCCSAAIPAGPPVAAGLHFLKDGCHDLEQLAELFAGTALTPSYTLRRS